MHIADLYCLNQGQCLTDVSAALLGAFQEVYTCGQQYTLLAWALMHLSTLWADQAGLVWALMHLNTLPSGQPGVPDADKEQEGR